jgi:hypothetical protein
MDDGRTKTLTMAVADVKNVARRHECISKTRTQFEMWQ